MRKAAVCAAICAALWTVGCSGSATPPGGPGGTAAGSTGGTTVGTGATSTGSSGGTTIGSSVGTTGGTIGGSFSTGAASTASSTTGTSGATTAGATSTSSTTSTTSGTTGTTSSGTTGTSGGATTGAGPWPNASVTSYSPGEEIVDVSTDEAENIWAVSHTGLYLLKPGQSSFHKYTAADGLSLANAASPGIMNVAGGKAGEVFVGYNGADVSTLPQVNGDPAHDAVLKEGGVDHVQLNGDGTLTVVHPDVHSNDYIANYPDGGTETDYSFYEDRGTRRMLYDHHSHPGTLYIGWNHGVDRFDWGVTDPTTGFPYADHVHPIVTSQTQYGTTEWMGEWRGLAVDPTQGGMLWMGGEYTGGAIGWTSALYDWTCQRSDCPHGPNNFVHAWAKAWGAPLFPVANDGDPMNIRAVTVTPDGTVYFASGPQWNPGTDKVYGIAVFKNGALSYLDPVSQLHLPSNQLMDMVAMPDGTLAIAVLDAGLYRYDPATGATFQVQGVPNHINMLYLDTMVSPAALYAATDQGFTVLRDTH